MKIRDRKVGKLVDVSRADCLTRGCYWPRSNPGSFTQGRGYRSYGDKRDGEWICGRREIDGCPIMPRPGEPAERPVCPDCGGDFVRIKDDVLELVLKCVSCGFIHWNAESAFSDESLALLDRVRRIGNLCRPPANVDVLCKALDKLLDNVGPIDRDVKIDDVDYVLVRRKDCNELDALIRAKEGQGGTMKITTTLEVAEADLPGVYSWGEAVKACADLGEGWRLPTKEELNLLYQHKDEIGGFGEGWLWSSSQNNNNNAWVQSFSDGGQFGVGKDFVVGVRAVWDLKKEAGKDVSDLLEKPAWREGVGMPHAEVCKALIAGWEALPEGDGYPVDLIQAWLDKHIYPVVQAARAAMEVVG